MRSKSLFISLLLIAGLLTGCAGQTDKTSSAGITDATGSATVAAATNATDATITVSASVTEGSAAAADQLVITGLEANDITLTVDQIKSARTYSGKVTGANSAGKQLAYDIKGAYLSDILQNLGYKQQDLEGIRMIASDGYSIQVPHDVLAARDVILAYEVDGKPLDKGDAPIRVFIPDERAMYWAKMLVKIEVTKTAASDTVSGLFIMDSLYSSSDYEDYDFLGQPFKTLNTKKILAAHPGSGGDIVLMTAADGLEKNETVENFYKGAINMTGADTPQFFSSTLPIGMSVKNLMFFKYGGSAFVFAAKTIEKEGTVTLQSLAKLCVMNSGRDYIVSFKDGASKDISLDEAQSWNIGHDAAKGVFIYKAGTTVKYWDIISININ